MKILLISILVISIIAIILFVLWIIGMREIHKGRQRFINKVIEKGDKG